MEDERQEELRGGGGPEPGQDTTGCAARRKGNYNKHVSPGSAPRPPSLELRPLLTADREKQGHFWAGKEKILGQNKLFTN